MKKDLTESVMQEIDNSNITIRPTWFFVLVSSFLGISVILSAFFAAILVKTMWVEIDSGRDIGLWSLGMDSLTFFPWLLSLLSLLAVVLTILLMTKYKVSIQYRMKMFATATLTGLLGVIVIASVVPSLGQSTAQKLGTYNDISSYHYLECEVVKKDTDEMTVKSQSTEETYRIKLSSSSPDFMKGDFLRILSKSKIDKDDYVTPLKIDLISD